MKKIFLLAALCALTMGGYATDYYYKCGVTKVEYEDQSYTKDGIKRNIYKVTINHTGKNMNGYSNTTVYDATVTFYLTSDDGTLDGTYTTEGFESIGSTYDKNYINYDNTKVKVVGYDERSLHPDYVSTLVINKEAGENQFSIGECTFYATNSKFTKQHRYTYYYCYDVDDIQNPNVALKPFVFGIQTEYVQQVCHYDITVNGISVIRDDSEYDAKRYFLTLNCTGKNRADLTTHNYEIQLAIYPQSESIVGTFSTRGNSIYMYAPNSYVKDLNLNKQRNLNNDSTSVIQIKSAAGDKQYSFYGGTLICTDVDYVYANAHPNEPKRIEAVHYYHFSDEAIPFGYDESQTIFNLTPSKVTVEEETDGFELTVKASDGSVSYTIYLDILTEELAGSYTKSAGTLGEWSKVERGSSSSYLSSGSTITITAKGNNTYTISGNLIGENGNTYTISAFDFQYGNSGGGGSGEGGETIEPINLTATNVTIQDLYIDKYNYFVTIDATAGNNVYEVAFDVWPSANSPIGSFSASAQTIKYVNSYVHQTKENGKSVNRWYDGEENSAISLTIVSNGDGTCTLSGSIEAENNDKMYTFIIAPYTWNYSAEPVDPDPEQDPYRFEPTEPTTINFVGDVVSFRDRDTYIEVTLNEMANETYDWIELRLMSDTMDMPAGNYIINDSYAAGTLTASKGYLGGTAGDDPSFVAIRADKEDWGQYTPYYLASGTINVSFNEKGDTIFVTGTALSHNGTTININVKSYNMLYVDETPKEPEFVTLQIDTAYVTYRSDLSDSINNQYVYTFDFNQGDDYPEVIATVVMSKPMEFVAGTYSLADGTISGLFMAQDQADYEMYIYGVPAYDFTAATLTITPAENGQWTFTMHMDDAIGSTYDFTLTQKPEIAFYPEPTVDPAEQPYTDEMKEKASITIVLDTLVWDAKTVDKDGVIDIYLTQLEADINGLRAYIQLGMFADVAYPAAGTYPVNGTGENGTFNASYGRFESTLFPCYVTLMDGDGYAHAVWYLMSGDITLSYENGQPVLSGVCTSYYGSTITFTYKPKATGFEEVESENAARSKKILREGQIYILRGDKKYSIMGQEVR